MSDAIRSSTMPFVAGALALELAPGSTVQRDFLAQAQAGRVAALVAADLARFDGDAAALELATVGAHYDPVELLRPGWPLHRELAQLAARAPRDLSGSGMGRMVSFGAHDGRMPGSLAPAPEYGGGPLRVLPFLLSGDAGIAARVGAAFERDLVETGMAGADTALLAQDLFGMRVEHARYLTLHDLVAMTALQYEHAGLAPLWPLLETALLATDGEQWLDAPHEPLLHYTGGEARIALFSPSAWHARYAAGQADDTRLQRGFERFQARQRQYAAVLEAHGVPVLFAHCDAGAAPDL
jgi:hypothetical protein